MGDRPGPFAGVLEFSQRVGQGKLIFQEGSTRDFRRGYLSVGFDCLTGFSVLFGRNRLGIFAEGRPREVDFSGGID